MSGQKQKRSPPPGVSEGGSGPGKREAVSAEDLKSAVSDHAEEKAHAIQAKYGPVIDYPTLLRILEDKECVRYPVTIQFDSSRIEPGMFAFAEAVPEEPSGDEDEFTEYEQVTAEYAIVVHEAFKDRQDALPALILYQLVVVNYGDLANASDAEVFGSTVLGMDREAYYSQLCDLVDII